MSSAVISECGTYRYVLKRRVPQAIRWVKPVLWVMLNPSQADATLNDPTIRRCIDFTSLWGGTELTVVNLFGLRATNPKELAKHADPFGPDNARHVSEQIEAHQLGVIVAAWGANKMASKFESLSVLKMALRNANAQCLDVNKDGSPKHPLYVRANKQLIPWEYRA